jgi:hypothetical protein
MEHIKNLLLERQTGKIFLLSKWIDVSWISCTINYTNISPFRELSLGVCFKLYWHSLDWESQSRQFQEPSLNSWQILDSVNTHDSQEILDSFKTKVSTDFRLFWILCDPRFLQATMILCINGKRPMWYTFATVK